MNYDRLSTLVKIANRASGRTLLSNNPISLQPTKKLKETEKFVTPKTRGKKLNTQRGKTKPLFQHEMKSNSPYHNN